MMTTRPSGPQRLREAAEGRLQRGTAPSTAGWTVGAETLSVLYRLASDPESSADALKLLHELQTHQVELDLQRAQLEENESELALQLAHFQALYDHAPAGYLLLGRDGCILQSNRIASELLGVDVGRIKDHVLTSLLNPESRPAVLALLENAGKGNCEATEAVEVQALGSRRLGLVAGVAPGEGAILAMLFPEVPTRRS